MPGIALEIDGAMQQAPQPGRQFMVEGTIPVPRLRQWNCAAQVRDHRAALVC
jgi:hypothetical protein